MDNMILFSFAEYWWFYLAFVALIFSMLALDLGVFHRDAHEVKLKEAGLWSLFWVGFSLAFNLAFHFYLLEKLGPEGHDQAKQLSLEFLTGFVVEKALAVDNIFVFVLVFSAFGIPAKYQHRVLFFGILGALFFRAFFIALGSYLMAYHWVIVLFGIFLILTGLKMLFVSTKATDPKDSIAIKFLNRFIPLTSKFDGQKFFTIENGKTYGTPLLGALVFLEVSDIIFAVDSVPAIFAITNEPLIVFTSNVLAILGMRSLYFLLAGVIDRFVFLKHGLAFVLVFVGLKMAWLNEVYDGKFPVGVSLSIIAFILALSVVASLFRKPAAKK